jgi:hypothetical protein
MAVGLCMRKTKRNFVGFFYRRNLRTGSIADKDFLMDIKDVSKKPPLY